MTEREKRIFMYGFGYAIKYISEHDCNNRDCAIDAAADAINVIEENWEVEEDIFLQKEIDDTLYFLWEKDS